MLALGNQAGNPNEVVARYKGAHAKAPRLDVRFTYQVFSETPWTCKATLDGRSRAFMRVDSPTGQYHLSMAPPVIREIESSQRMYDDNVFPGEVTPVRSRLSSSASAFPTWVYIPDLLDLGPKGQLKFQSAGTKSIYDVPCDGLKGGFKMNGGGAEFVLWVDRDGMLRQFDSDVTQMGQELKQKWTVIEYRKRDRFENREFGLQIPIGYTPYALDYVTPAVFAGEPFPMKGWKTSTGQALDLKTVSKGKKMLVAILDREAPSSAATGSLNRLKAKLPLIIIGAEPSVPGATAVDGGALNRVKPNSTPYFALVGPDGKVIKLWMGYDPAKAAAFEKDVLGS